MGPRHALQIGTRLQQVSDRLLNQGTLYPALVRLEQYGWIKGTWGLTENNREAKFYAITKAGLKAMGERNAALEANGRTRRAPVGGGASIVNHLRRFVAKLLGLFGNTRIEEDLSREIASHLALLEEDFRRQGTTADEARLAARRTYSGVEHAKQLHHNERSILWLERTCRTSVSQFNSSANRRASPRSPS